MHYCSVCKKGVQPGIHSLRLNCKCYVHTKCMDQDHPDFSKCDACKGIVKELDLGEEASYEGRDYLLNPPGLKEKLWKNREPYQWIQEKRPIEWMVGDQGYGLHRLIANGIQIDHFLGGGYTWDELRKFRDMKSRPFQALLALGCNMEHFRDYPDLMQIPDLTGSVMTDYFGFYFPPDNVARVDGGYNDMKWTLKDLAGLGFTFADLRKAGLRYVEQYTDLEPTRESEKKMGITPADIDALEFYEEEEKPVKPTKKEAYVPRRAHRLRERK